MARPLVMSRAGRYTHNHKTYQNSIQHGCSSSEWRTGLEATETYAPHMQAAGYTLGFFGTARLVSSLLLWYLQLCDDFPSMDGVL